MSETPQQPGSEGADDPARSLDQRRIATYVDRVEAFWAADGLPGRTRRRLAVELEDGLVAALADGASPDDLLAADAHTLAIEIAEAEGISTVAAHAGDQPKLRGLVAWAFGGATAIGAFVWFFALDPIAGLVYTHPSTGALLTSVITSYGICGALTLAAAASGMAYYCRGLENVRRTTAEATAAIAVTGAIGVGVCVGIARLTNFSSAAAVLVYVLFVGASMTAGVAAVWHRHLTRGVRSRPASGWDRSRRADRRLRPTTTTATTARGLALAAMVVLGGVTGYLLLVALAGGRHDFVDQCFTQADGLTSCTDDIPRSYWVDVTAAGIGALIALGAAYVGARRPGAPEGSLYA